MKASNDGAGMSRKDLDSSRKAGEGYADFKTPQSKSTKLDGLLEKMRELYFEYDDGGVTVWYSGRPEMAGNELSIDEWLEQNINAYVESKVLEGQILELKSLLDNTRDKMPKGTQRINADTGRVEFMEEHQIVHDWQIFDRLTELEATPEGRSEK